MISRAGNLSASLTVTLSSPGGHDVAAFAETVTIGPNVTSQIVSIPISNDGQPGESDAVIPLSLSSPGSGASLGAMTTASLVIHDDNPFPAPVIVESVHWETIKVKVGSGKRAKTKSETAARDPVQRTRRGRRGPRGLSALERYHEEGQEKGRHELQAHPPDFGRACFQPHDRDGFAPARDQAEPLRRAIESRSSRPTSPTSTAAPWTATTTASPAAITWRS